jgi:ATP-dependent helicase HrpA
VAGHDARAGHPRPPLEVPPYPAQLPIVERREELLATIRDHQVVVVAGETGSGKSTQLPKLCLELGRGVDGMIGHTQPRRLAARAVAERVAEELGSEVGATVGYTVRFTDKVGPGTYLKVMTDGILLAEIQRDRELRAYDTIIVDEAHERSLNIDFLLGYLTQLLPRRPDLKLVITSATIDTARFAGHFGDAPVVEVSGRTYPVEVRYEPIGDDPDDDRDQVQAIIDAVAELGREGPGDVLVFLSGQREIRDTADALRRLDLPRTEILPLYARLSAAEQHRVFASHPGRRIVLATNVAETSLTVPGIRYVVDPGTARISRYNRRTKVQRLPIEPVSQASADQRTGRCGRVAPGICIRLYAEDDYDGRPEFTEPEILRTNLASVILQMAAIGLGDVAAFPFVDPPDQRSIADGIALLEELGALDLRRGDDHLRLTRIGRRLAQLPVDPRLGRMVLEAERNGCAREVLVIAAALAIIDPRERPAGEEQRADELHARFADPTSDFLAYLRLWEHLRHEQRQRGSSQFRKMCRAEHLNYLRVREWQDVHSQLRLVARRVGVSQNDTPADPDAIHRSLLAGLVSHVGAWDQQRQDYQGTRGSRFTIGRGSSLAGTHPKWVMAAELVETDRLRARTVARIRPEWIERAAAHLVRRSHGDPWWDEGRGVAMVEERVTLHGLPVADRRVAYPRVDHDHARELFVDHALVLGEWDAHHDFVERNARTIDQVRALEDKVRRRDILVGDDVIFDLFDARVPANVASVRDFDRWWRDERQRQPDLFDLALSELVHPGAGQVDERTLPDRWRTGDLDLALRYRFDLESPLDGVSVEVPLDVLNRFDGGGLDWQVPGFREELVTALIRSLPKPIRRAFVPVPDHVRDFLDHAGPDDGPLLDILGRWLTRTTGSPLPAGSWRLDKVPPHVLVTYVAVGVDGAAVSWSKDLAALQSELGGRIRDAVADAAPSIEQRGLRAWTIGELPRIVDLPRAGRTVRAYPALVDEGESVAVRVTAGEAEQAAAMRAGTRRLLLLGLRTDPVTRALPDEVKLVLVTSPVASVAELVADACAAAVDELVDSAGGPAWDAVAYDALAASVRDGFVDTAVGIATRAARVLGAAAEIDDRLASLTAPVLQPSVADVRTQLDRLVHPGFVRSTGFGRLAHMERYLQAVLRRLDKLPEDPGRDRRLLAEIRELEDDYAAVAPRDPGGEVGWMLEELRVSVFAQQLGTAQPVSPQRIRKAMHRLA